MTKMRIFSALIMSVFVVVFVATLSVMTVATYGEAEAGQKVFQWKLAMSEPPNNLFYMTIARWARELERRSGGRVQIKQYHSGQLCGIKELLEGVKTGMIDVTSPCPAYYPAQMPLWESRSTAVYRTPEVPCSHFP